MHRSIEILIGRLVTDEDFRAWFSQAPAEALASARALGLELSTGEERALLDTDHRLWDQVATQVDTRLLKASLRPRAGATRSR